MPRAKVSVLLAPATIYQHAAHVAEGYAPAESARFAVVRTSADAPWELVHRRSGARVGSLLPALPRKLTMTDMLAVAAALHAHTELDWAPFDTLPECTPETKRDDVKFADMARAQRLALELRRIASQALGLAIAA